MVSPPKPETRKAKLWRSNPESHHHAENKSNPNTKPPSRLREARHIYGLNPTTTRKTRNPPPPWQPAGSLAQGRSEAARARHATIGSKRRLGNPRLNQAPVRLVFEARRIYGPYTRDPESETRNPGLGTRTPRLQTRAAARRLAYGLYPTTTRKAPITPPRGNRLKTQH